jgi:TfoX/Sxy family transcriptional regulator of competence genes
MELGLMARGRAVSPSIDPFTAAILSWPDVTPRRMFGADCFLVAGHMFGFTWNGDVACWVPDEQYDAARALDGVRPLQIRPGTPMGTWLTFPLRHASDLVSRLRQSYEHYRDSPPKHARRRHRGTRPARPRQ